MICQKCRASLTQRNTAGEPIVRNRGLVLKASGWVAICPRCRGEVPFAPETLVALPRLVVLRPAQAET